MKTNFEKKKAFALKQIKPYYKKRSLCGYSNDIGCCYLTDDGKMCVAGKNLLKPENYKESTTSIRFILESKGQEILKPRSRDILTPDEWSNLQSVHDNIATADGEESIARAVKSLGLFTMEELRA